ncbi:myosin heavy chain, embryonic smooth muscle isoform-like [Stylophora pistillata]|uniref:myosin heavy chain, embryonic smooth muscle isoform-like n=1 Tax=Stylophora pistillata TaxID=50429 RepID=UPI000C0415BA|nr:myosin heavy chain, embryonic smooth muscle isoform-like [Stylophora pistillata]
MVTNSELPFYWEILQIMKVRSTSSLVERPRLQNICQSQSDMTTAASQKSAFTNEEEPGRQLQYQDSHSNQEHALDGPSELTKDSITCTKTTQHLCTSEPQERQNRVTGIRQELLASEDEFIKLKTEFSICKHVLEERLIELRNISESAKKEIENLKTSLDFQIQDAKRHLERQKELQVSVEGEDKELRRDSEKCKQATKKRLEEFNQLRVFVERDTEELRKDFERSKQAAKEQVEELNRLRVLVERDKKELQKDYEKCKQATKEQLEEFNQLRDYVGRCKDDLRGNFAMGKQAANEDIEELREPRDINKKERHESGENLPMNSRKRPILKRLKGLFGKTSSRRKKKLTTEEASNLHPYNLKFEETDLFVTTNVDALQRRRDFKRSNQAAEEQLEERNRSRGTTLSLKDEYFTSDIEADSDSDSGRPRRRFKSLCKSKLKASSLSTDSVAGFNGTASSIFGYLTDTELYNPSRCSSNSGASYILSSARGSVKSQTRRRSGRSRVFMDDEEIFGVFKDI